MPIRVTCQCGQTLSVPDEMAGKRGKCPKCKEVLQIPAATAKSANAPKTAAASKGSASASKAAAAPAAGNTMASLFDDVGLVQKKGRFCPSCDAQVPASAVMCVACGFNFAEGKKLEGFQAESSRQFGNKHLNEAAVMMEREKSVQDRLMGAGAPWWMLFSVLIGIAVVIAGVSIKMNAGTTGELSSIQELRRIQEATYLDVLAGSFGAAMILISICATLAIVVSAFKESALQGALVLFAPFYIYYYMFSRMFSRYLTTTVIIYWATAILGCIALGYAAPRI